MIVAVLGAESTGKTLLSLALAERLPALTGRPAVAVSEWLREWCDAAGRTPRADEQAAIAERQRERLLEAERALGPGGWVVADTTPLTIAVYSDLLFGDRSLYPMALEFQRAHCAATLLTAIDLPWVADGQRDGPHAQAPVDALLRAALAQAGIAPLPVAGLGDARVERALQALAPWLGATFSEGAASARGR